MMAMKDHFALRGELIKNEPMSRHTSWRVGGIADRYYRPADVHDLSEFLRIEETSDEIYWLGLGSNLLVRDGGIRGTVIALFGVLDEMRMDDQEQIMVQAGVSCAKFARFVAKQGFVGAEFFAGIPGTIGGALAMNAGAYGGETWSQIVEVETMDRYGQIHNRTAADFDISYRTVKSERTEWFISAKFRFEKGCAENGSEKIKQLLRRRADSQPLSLPSCGSVFRNPENDHAARLIEESNLKGYRVGGASVSTRHANFIVNDNNAKAADIEKLIQEVAARVYKDHGVRLKTEVRIIGEPIIAHEDDYGH